MMLVAAGYTSKQIARELGISPSTVDNHVHAVVERLGAINRIDAARIISEATPRDLPQDYWNEFEPSPVRGSLEPKRWAYETRYLQAPEKTDCSVARSMFLRVTKLAGTFLIGMVLVVYLVTSVVSLIKLL